jgi:hypothetical protein
VAQSVAREHEKFKAKIAHLATECQKLDDACAAHNATKALACATKRGLQLCLLAMQRSSGGRGGDPATAPATQV